MYVIKDTTTEGIYIALDYGSGGYPYDVSLRYAHIWDDREEALKYMEMFKGKPWIVKELIMKVI